MCFNDRCHHPQRVHTQKKDFHITFTAFIRRPYPEPITITLGVISCPLSPSRPLGRTVSLSLRALMLSSNFNGLMALTDPVKMSESIFESFEKIAKKQNKEQVPPVSEAPQKKQNQGKPNKKPPSSNPPKPSHFKSLEEAMKALDVSELKQQLEKSQSMFPENPSVWLKDLAGYLNYKLPAPDSDPTLCTYAHDYPYSLAGKELRSVIKGLLGKCSDCFQDFFDHCVLTMLRELDRQPGDSLHGYRICIQAIMHDKPKIATVNLAEHLELLRSHQNRPLKCLTIMWALGQAGFYDLSQGLKVWLGIMLPVLGVKSLSAYAIAYLERLLLLHANLTKGFGIMGPKEFFPLLDFAYMPKNSLSPSLQEQLRRLYPRLKVLAFGAKPESLLHTYFPSFLSRATPHCPDTMKKELLISLTECLSVDAQTLGVWRQLYTKYLSQSSLQETIQSFKVTNEQMGECDEVQECKTLCNNIQTRMRGQGFPWTRLLLAMLVFAAGFIAHDIRSHGSFADSMTALYLRTSGVSDASQQAWSKVSLYSQGGLRWLEENTPYYYSYVWVRKTLILLFELCEDENLSGFQILFLMNLFLFCLSEQVNVNTPDSVFQFIEYVKELLLLLQRHYILPAWHYAVESLQHAWKAFQESCKYVAPHICLHIA
uniref:Transmembrane protein 214 n=1 Tax=Denticeps clupeoides TaxID=299321 RepID=A0A8C4ARD0_9TELE